MNFARHLKTLTHFRDSNNLSIATCGRTQKTLRVILLIPIMATSSLHGEFLAGQNVVDGRLEIIDSFIDIQGVRTSTSNTTTDFLDVFIDFKLWPLFYSINGTLTPVGEVEFSWNVSVDVDHNLETGSGADHPYPGTDYEIRCQRIRQNGASAQSTIGPGVMTSSLYQFSTSTNTFILLPTVLVSENSLIFTPPPGSQSPGSYYFRLGCVVPGLSNNSRLGVWTFLRGQFTDQYDYTEQNALAYFPLIKTQARFTPTKVIIDIKNALPQVQYGLESSTNLKNWKLEGLFSTEQTGEITTFRLDASAPGKFYRTSYNPGFNFP